MSTQPQPLDAQGLRVTDVGSHTLGKITESLRDNGQVEKLAGVLGEYGKQKKSGKALMRIIADHRGQVVEIECLKCHKVFESVRAESILYCPFCSLASPASLVYKEWEEKQCSNG